MVVRSFFAWCFMLTRGHSFCDSYLVHEREFFRIRKSQKVGSNKIEVLPLVYSHRRILQQEGGPCR